MRTWALALEAAMAAANARTAAARLFMSPPRRLAQPSLSPDARVRQTRRRIHFRTAKIPDGPRILRRRARLPRRSARLRAAQPPRRPRREGAGRQAPFPRRFPALAPDPRRARLGRPRLAEGIRRAGMDAGAAAHLRRGMLGGRRALRAPVRRAHGRTRHPAFRQLRAEGILPAAHPVRRALVVPGLFGAGLGLGPRVPEDARRAPGRPLRRERPEDLEYARAIRRLDLLP